MRKIIYDLTNNFMPLDVLKCLLSCLKISWLKIFNWLLVSAFFPYREYLIDY